MPKPYFKSKRVVLYHGDTLAVAQRLPSNYVNCIVTSPPYFGLRDYGTEGQYGLESSPAEYVERLRTLFSELRRVLADDGTLWLNIGDSYANDAKWGGSTGGKHSAKLHGGTKIGRAKRTTGIPAKNLIGIPWRIAFALQDDGWILRNAIIWHKPNAMPESVTDRLSKRYEHLFLFSKSQKYYFYLDGIREKHQAAIAGKKGPGGGGVGGMSVGLGATGESHLYGNPKGKNPGDVWAINTQPFPEAHFATYPQELPRRCVKAGCPEGGIVLDPFHGSGTTGLVATELGRRYIGVDINSKYLDMSLDSPKRNLRNRS